MNRSSSKSDPDQHENRRPKANASSNGLRAVKDHELDEPSRETRVCRDNSSPVQPTESPETPPSDLSKGTAGEQSSNSVTTTMLYGTIVQEQPHHRKISDHPATNEFPSSVGRYQIEALLGRGGMGSVYRAHDTQLNRKVALKVPKFEMTTTSRLIDRFYREARLAANLSHPNLCPVFDVGEVDGTHYIAMALIKGATLANHISNNQELSERFAAKTVCKVARAMQEAHSSGIIHRDLKPANIMIDHRKEPIVMDFGLACPDELGDDSRLTQEGALVGSPAYMSPEQLRGSRESIRQSSDVYSLGIVLYEILSGKLPFAGNGSIGSMISQILTEDPTELKSLRPSISDALARICAKAMAKTPDNRYASMETFANDLERFIRSQPSRKKSAGNGVIESLEEQIAVPSDEKKAIQGDGVTGADGHAGCIPHARSNNVLIRATIASVAVTCFLVFLGVCFWPSPPSGGSQDEDSNASGLIIKADDPELWGDVMAVVIDPVDFIDQQSHNREASDVECEFFELLKRTAHQVLAENAVPIRTFGNDDWAKVASVSRNDDGSLNFTDAVISLLQENEANLFITIGGYFDQVSNTYHFDIGIFNSEGICFQSSHMEFEDEVVKGTDRAAVRESFVAWFNENFERLVSDE